MLNRKIHYEFIEDKDPVLYKTKYFNQMANSVNTPYLAIWDADIIPDKKAIIECVQQLRNQEVDVTYPYDGICYDIPQVIKPIYFKKRDIKLLYCHFKKMNQLYKMILVGGTVIVNRKKYLQAGAENEAHYGWGNDDFDRFQRFKILDYKIYRYPISLFHLSHPRFKNSFSRDFISGKISVNEYNKIQNLTQKELISKLNLNEGERVIKS